MSDLILEFKKNKLSDSVSLLVAESKVRNYLVQEGVVDVFNYGVTTRAIDQAFGGKDKLDTLVKNELLKKYGKTDISQLDANEIQQEILLKSNSAAKELASSEFVNGIKRILEEGIINGIVNACFNALLTLVTTFNPAEAIKALISGFIRGILIKFLLSAIALVYNEAKKRILKDPYATPTPGEMIVLVLLTIASFTTIMGVMAGASANSIIIAIVANIFFSVLLTVLFNITDLGQKLYNFFNNIFGRTVSG